MKFELCHAAGNMFMGRDRRRRVIKFAAINGDIFTLSEVLKDHAYIASSRSIDSYVVGELGIGWDSSRFERVDAGRRLVMRGGKRGAGRRRGDRRRRGPSRLVIWVLLRDRETGEWILVFTHHAIAKADTQHPWRRALRRQGFTGVTKTILRVAAKYPGVPVVLTGDLNTIGRIWAFARAKLRQVKTPATFGRRLRYDRIYVSGTVAVSGVRRVRTAGDHRALIADVQTKEVA